jgi:hypothetical protein
MLKYSISSKTYSSIFSKLSRGGSIFLWNQIFKIETSLFTVNEITQKSHMNKGWGRKTPFLKVLIIRGIGYRGFITLNDLNGDGREKISVENYKRFLFSDELLSCEDYSPQVEVNYIMWHYLVSSFFLTLRAGHTVDANWKVFAKIRNGKKNRKLVLLNRSKIYVNHLANTAWQYRKPSVYTGRGVRRKGVRVIRKAGKRDQKGRGF